MSHIEASTTRIKNLKALEAAAKDLGAVLAPEKTYRWYERSVGDYPLPPGLSKDDLGKCDYTLSLPGVTYQIGMFRMPDGTYQPLYDFYGDGTYRRTQGGFHDGQKLKAHFGDKLSKLSELYQHHAARLGCLPGQQCLKVDSLAAAKRASLLTGHKITYSGKLRTIITAAA